MKNTIILCLVLVASLTGCNKTKNTLTEQEVMAIINKFDDGWRHKNLKEVDETLSPVYVYFTQSGGTFSRDSVVQTAGSPEYLLDKMERSSFTVSLYGNTAVVSTRWKGKGIYKGTAFDEDQRCSITIIKKDNKVQILTEHCTPIKQNAVFH
jgi:uncharacterized lipoprotein YehR (DUF1307 family)